MARVFAAAEELGYRPNRAALGLRLGQFNSFGLLIPDLQNQYFTLCAELIEDHLRRHEADLIIESSRNSTDLEESILSTLFDRQIDGLVVCLIDVERNREVLHRLAKSHPIVLMTEKMDAALDLDLVLADYTEGIRECVRALSDYGHQKFLYVQATVPGQAAGHRPEVFFRSLSELGLPADSALLVQSGIGHDDVAARMAGVFSKPKGERPTAILAHNDVTAISIMRAACQAGLRVPEDVSIVGVDDSPICSKLPVTLSSIQVPMSEITEEVVALLIRGREKAGSRSTRSVVFQTQFVARESVGAAPSI